APENGSTTKSHITEHEVSENRIITDSILLIIRITYLTSTRTSVVPFFKADFKLQANSKPHAL
ncbi:MAG: hypothetical protein KBT67_10760, partial [bacterium]|nr:hypothetical protein [Candidatus Limimorpha caballi]